MAVALWRDESEVRFRLTISAPEPQGGNCGCGEITSVPQGIQMLTDTYNCIKNMLHGYGLQLEARIEVITAMPSGSMTQSQLLAEYHQYLDEINEFRKDINRFGNCINKLAAFFSKLTWQEKQEYPDFWDRHQELWDMADDLWNIREGLYDLAHDLYEAGKKKIQK